MVIKTSNEFNESNLYDRGQFAQFIRKDVQVNIDTLATEMKEEKHIVMAFEYGELDYNQMIELLVFRYWKSLNKLCKIKGISLKKTLYRYCDIDSYNDFDFIK